MAGVRGVADPKRRRRYELRDELRGMSQLERVAFCGRRMTGAQVSVLAGERGTAFGGVQTCGSVWACPVCSAMIRQRRAREIEDGVVPFLDKGGSALFFTGTVPHTVDLPLKRTLKVVSGGWSKLRRTRSVADCLARNGFLGIIKAVEITHGRNGWHPHVHIMLLFDRQLSPDELADLSGVLEAGWLGMARRAGFGSAAALEYGVTVEPVRTSGSDALARYLSKVQDGKGMAPSLELARSDLKTGRRRSCTPFELIAQHETAVKHGDDRKAARLRALWQEYEAATRGVRAIFWSAGLKDLLGVREVSDDQAVEETINEGAKVVMVLNGWEWRAVCASGARGILLCTVDKLGVAPAQALVAALLEQDRQRAAAPWTDPD